MDPTYFAWAVILGGLSAVSLPLGSVVGIMARPRATVTASLAAFGAGGIILEPIYGHGNMRDLTASKDAWLVMSTWRGVTEINPS